MTWCEPWLQALATPELLFFSHFVGEMRTYLRPHHGTRWVAHTTWRVHFSISEWAPKGKLCCAVSLVRRHLGTTRLGLTSLFRVFFDDHILQEFLMLCVKACSAYRFRLAKDLFVGGYSGTLPYGGFPLTRKFLRACKNLETMYEWLT